MFMKNASTVAFNYPEDAWGRARKNVTYIGHWQQPAPLSNCFSPVFISLSLMYASRCSLAFLVFLFSWKAHVSAVLIFELLSFRRTWYVNLQCLHRIVLGSGILASVFSKFSKTFPVECIKLLLIFFMVLQSCNKLVYNCFLSLLGLIRSRLFFVHSENQIFLNFRNELFWIKNLYLV